MVHRRLPWTGNHIHPAPTLPVFTCLVAAPRRVRGDGAAANLPARCTPGRRPKRASDLAKPGFSFDQWANLTPDFSYTWPAGLQWS
jgi:hypothetical protein